MIGELPAGYCMVKRVESSEFGKTGSGREKTPLTTGRGCIFSGKVMSKYPQEKWNFEKQSEKRRVGLRNYRTPNCGIWSNRVDVKLPLWY